MSFDDFLGEKLKDASFCAEHSDELNELKMNLFELSELQKDKSNSSVAHVQRIIQLNKSIAVLKGQLMGYDEINKRV